MIVAGFILLFIVFLAFMIYASYSIESGIYIKAFCRMRTNDRIVALTFDDGPDNIQTPKVLDVLKDYNVRATFFCIGSKVKGNEAIIQRMISEGHTIGNHSYTHKGIFPLYSTQRVIKELEQCNIELENVSHKRINWFRPPFGVTNPTIAKAVKKLGYITIGWNIRSLDTQSLSHKKILHRINRRLRPGSIILLHDRMPRSEILVKCLLDELRIKQYRVIGLGDMVNTHYIEPSTTKR